MVARDLTIRGRSAPPRAALAALVAGAGVAFACWAEAMRLRSNWPLEWVAVDIVPGLAFLLFGWIGTVRRPDTLIGPAMILAGFAWYSGTAAASQDPALDRVFGAFQGYYDGILAWLALAYPTGRLQTRTARLSVVAIFVVLAARTLFRFVAFRMSTDYDFSIPSEADRFIADAMLRENGETWFAFILAGLMAVVIVLLVQRLRSERGAARDIAWPMILAGLALALGILIEVGAVALATNPEDRFGAWALADMMTSASGAGMAGAFLLGLMRGRLARQRVADLVVELDGAADRPGLRDVVARALRDPSAELLYPGSSPDTYIDATGTPHTLGDLEPASRAVTRIETGGETLAVLVHDPAISEQPELLRSVIAAVRLAIENERLAAEVRAQLGEVRASRARIVAAGDEQRRRIERDLHDGAQQRLVTLALRLQMARDGAEAVDGELGAALDAASRELEGAIGELRELARGLHPAILATDGLRAAIEALADRTPVAATVDVVGERFDESIESTAYFVVAEALTNVVRSAGASRVAVRIASVGNALHVEIEDDGVGGADPERGSGLRGLADRVAAVGGRFAVESPTGGGTRIRAELPCE